MIKAVHIYAAFAGCGGTILLVAMPVVGDMVTAPVATCCPFDLLSALWKKGAIAVITPSIAFKLSLDITPAAANNPPNADIIDLTALSIPSTVAVLVAIPQTMLPNVITAPVIT